jgi:hypothetical protein
MEWTKENMFDTCLALATCVDHSPQKLMRRSSLELGMPQPAMQYNMKKDLNLKLYCPAFTNELSDVDMNQHCDTCHALLNTFPNTTSCLKGLFTDRCTVYCSTCDRNVTFLAKERLHSMIGVGT